jgi:hypothetical protein
MIKLLVALHASVLVAGTSVAQTPAAAAPAAGAVRAVQPGLIEVAGPRVNEAITAGITKITATPGKGSRSIVVQSPWGYSYFGWPKNLKPIAFTIDMGKPAGGATISAPGINEANKADYKAAIEGIVRHAVITTEQNRAFAEGFR